MLTRATEMNMRAHDYAIAANKKKLFFLLYGKKPWNGLPISYGFCTLHLLHGS